MIPQENNPCLSLSESSTLYTDLLKALGLLMGFYAIDFKNVNM